MKFKILCVSLTLASIAFVAGCQVDSRRSAFNQVEVGQTETELEQTLGEPNIQSPSAWEYNESSYQVTIPVNEGYVAGSPVFEEYYREWQNPNLEAYIQ